LKSARTSVIDRATAYGEERLTPVDHFGVFLSRRAVERAIPDGRDLSVLDLGCGYHAALLRALLPRLERGVGVDLRVSAEAKRARRLTFLETTVEDALGTLPDASFDVVMLISVLEHLSDPQAALSATRRLLRPSGTLLINVPTWRGKTFLEFSAFRLGTSPACEMDDHKMYYDTRDLWPLLVRAGFRPREIRLKSHKFGLNLFAVARVAAVAERRTSVANSCEDPR
jgi:SAM-dependent methyltransferase